MSGMHGTLAPVGWLLPRCNPNEVYRSVTNQQTNKNKEQIPWSRVLLGKLTVPLLVKVLFTNRFTLYQSYKTLKFTLKHILKLLLHVSAYDHHQGAYI